MERPHFMMAGFCRQSVLTRFREECRGETMMHGIGGIRRRRSASAVLGWIAVGVLFCVSTTGEAGAPAVGQGYVVLTHPVSVRVLQAKDEAGSYSIELDVALGSDRYRVTTSQRGDTLEEALDGQKGDTRWQGRYLLIGYDRGGGNASRGWVAAVFTVKNGKLLHIGEADLDKSGKGIFRNWYNKFEINSLTSSAGAPMFPVVLEERDNQMRASLERTWTENRTAYRRTARTIQEILRRSSRTPQDLHLDLPEALLFNAVLAKYCERSAELDQNLQAADTTLAAEDLQQVRDIVARVVPGELPRPAVKVVRIPQ